MPLLPSSFRLVTAAQLGQLLVAARKQCKLTQAQVGHRVCLSQNRISYLEKNPDDISFRQLLMWSAAVGLELHLAERDNGELQNEPEW
ncbi:helix-turn-helix domain-containing protein [Massilia sp. 9I]|uniref:helix-turn-helix domain-containing protein n=1 Tax=Massilia sp. 9I TaxID=2653152 RepID=UPI00135B0C71|nr:helix-turn-helix domain-containing protein [Massilia sp. 9I]